MHRYLVEANDSGSLLNARADHTVEKCDEELDRCQYQSKSSLSAISVTTIEVFRHEPTGVEEKHAIS